MKCWVKCLFALSTGVAMALPFLSFHAAWARHLGWIPFFAMAPLGWVLLCAPLPRACLARVREALFLGWVTGAVFFLTTLFWISSVAWEGVVLLPSCLALYFACWALFVVMVVRPLFFSDEKKGYDSSWRSLGAVLLSSAGWVGIEWLRGTLFTGFGWNSFGVTFYQNISLIQFVDITGVAGLSFLGVVTGCMAAIAMVRVFQKRDRRMVLKSPYCCQSDVSFVLGLVIVILTYGAWVLSAPLPLQQPLSVAAVQGNIPQNHKWDRTFEEEIMAVYEQETRSALPSHPDLVIWPEAATPRPLLNDEKIFSQVSRLLEEGRVDLLAGSLYYQEHPSRDYNAAILLSPSNRVPQIYAKMHLVPFGEYVPFRKTFPLFEWIVGSRVLGDFDSGPEPKVLKLSTQPICIAPLICFEDTLGDLVRHFALRRAQLLITLTNDGWFGHTIASQQHTMNALFRSAETKLPLLRCANTGITCVIDRYGRLTQMLQNSDGSTFFKGVLLSRIFVPRDPIPTFYTKHGDWFSYLCLGMMMIALIWLIFIRLLSKFADASKLASREMVLFER